MALILFKKYFGDMTLTLVFHHRLTASHSNANHKLCVSTTAEGLNMNQ